MFWGITIDAGKRYSQIVEKGFHLSMAALEHSANTAGQMVQVIYQHGSSEFLLCTLQSGKTLQQALDYVFLEGEEISFSLNGSGVVHLTGYLLSDEETEQTFDESEDDSGNKRKRASKDKGMKKIRLESNTGDDDDDDDEDDEDFSEDDVEFSEDEAEFDSDFDEEDESEEEEEEDSEEDADLPSPKKQEVKKTPSKKEGKTPQQEDKNLKTPKGGAAQSPKGGKTPATPQENAATPSAGDSESKKKKKKKKKKNKDNAADESSANTPSSTPKADTPKSTPASPKKRAVAGGTVVEDLKVGHGPEAKPGKMVSVYYVGTLAKNNKRFDSCTSGKPFRFRLNQGEVIKGWDNGVAGMKVGGKRKITVPANQGYGNSRQGPIPPNSVLTFEVELKAVS